jgi:glutathione S-transferase
MVTLYWMSVSHPSQAARKMLELKGVEFRTVDVLPLSQRVHLRLVGFRGGTVPALRLQDGTRVQGSRRIARALDKRWPDPPLFPAEPELRARVEEAERWGEEQLQPVPRRIGRWGALTSMDVRRWAAAANPVPGAELLVRSSGPLIRYYGRTREADGRRADEAGAHADVAALPQLLDHVDQLLGDGTLTLEPPNAATLQILASVRILLAFDDLRDLVESHACAGPTRRIFPTYPEPMPRFLPADWLPAAAA